VGAGKVDTGIHDFSFIFVFHKILILVECACVVGLSLVQVSSINLIGLQMISGLACHSICSLIEFSVTILIEI
jgi:hypothetical protein